MNLFVKNVSRAFLVLVVYVLMAFILDLIFSFVSTILFGEPVGAASAVIVAFVIWIWSFWGFWLVRVTHNFSDPDLSSRFITSADAYVNGMHQRLTDKGFMFDEMQDDWYVYMPKKGLRILAAPVKFRVSENSAELIIPLGGRKMIPAIPDTKLS